MDWRVAVALVVMACSTLAPPDGGPDAGCDHPVPGCACGAGGGSVHFSDRLAVASEAGTFGVNILSWAPHGGGGSLSLLAGRPVSLAVLNGLLVLSEGDAGAQRWQGHLQACDPPFSFPEARQAAGPSVFTPNAVWYVRAPGDVARFHPDSDAGVWAYSQLGRRLESLAVEPTTGRLFAASPSDGGISVWSAPGAPVFQLPADDVSTLAVAADRLYAGNTRGDVLVWDGAPTIAAPRAPDLLLSAGAPIIHLAVASGQLVATVRPTPTTGRVLIWRDIANLSAPRTPDVVVDHVDLAGARKTSGRFVLADVGVVELADFTGTATVKGTIPINGGIDILYLP